MHREDSRAEYAADRASALYAITEQGLKEEALRRAAKILRTRRPTAEEINSALRAIHIHARFPSRWKRRVTTMVDRLPKRTRHAAREALLRYYACAQDHERAAPFIAATRRFSPESLRHAADTLVALGRFEDLEDLVVFVGENARIYCNAFRCEARATVLSAQKEFWEAISYRLLAPVSSSDGVLGCTLVKGVVESALAMLIQDLGTRLSYIHRARETFKATAARGSPTRSENAFLEEERLCLLWRARLLRLIPKSHRHRYRLQSPAARRHALG